MGGITRTPLFWKAATVGLQWPGRVSSAAKSASLPRVRSIATALIPVAIPVCRAPAASRIQVSVEMALGAIAAAAITPAGVATASLVPIHDGKEVDGGSSDAGGHAQGEQGRRWRLCKLRGHCGGELWQGDGRGREAAWLRAPQQSAGLDAYQPPAMRSLRGGEMHSQQKLWH